MNHICEGTFGRCRSLHTLTLPKGLKRLDEWSFWAISSLTDVFCQAVEPPALHGDVFDKNIATLHVPAASVEAYKKSKWGKAFRKVRK